MARILLLAAAIFVSGCMGRVTFSPQEGQAQASATKRLWYVGVGLYDESWSEGDVAATSLQLAARAQGLQVMPVVFSNGTTQRFPPASRANIDAATADIAQRAQPGDVVLVYVSTHGAPGLLAREVGGQQQMPASVDEVREWLAPLRDRPTVLVLSACFSGSFIPALQADNRIIFAAARADRTSFGCRAGAEHTVFGDALLGALETPQTSLRTLVRRVRADVTRREDELGVSRPSHPQVSVGPSVQKLYDEPVF